MAYLVTGGAGFIGSHLATSLLARGETVVILDNFNDYYDVTIKRDNARALGNHQQATVIEGDVRDADLINTIYAEHNITHVAHLAAMAGVRASVDQTPLYMQVNTIGSMNLLEAARDYNVEQFVLASTSSVYGNTEVLPFIETDSADRPLAAYPASKRAAEILAHTYNNLHDMHINVLRFFNVYGAAGRPDMMPMRLFNAAFDDDIVIPLFNGGDISRDWTYIDDTVRGVLAALDTPLGYEVMNLGVGRPISLLDFVDIIQNLTGKTIRTRHVPTPLSDPPMTYCNNEKAQRLLGFAPNISVQEGLSKMWAWYRENMLK
jgi:UDP-glucuronate 4-epimerase